MGVATAIAVGSVAAGVGANVIGRASSASDREKAANLYGQALKEIQAIGAPPDVAKEIILEKFQQAGILNPEMEAALELGVSQVQQIKDSEELKTAQKEALNQLAQRAKGGLTPEDRAALEEEKSRIEQQAQAEQASIVQNMQQRGMGGAGAELAARLAGSQAATQRAAKAGIDTAAIASANALQAGRQYGDFAGQIQQQQFNRDVTRGTAADEINKFNLSTASAVQQRNVGSRNLAQQFNVQRQQEVSDKNVAAQNRELERQRQAQLDMYNANLRRAQILSGAYSDAGGQAQASARDTQKFWGGIGTSVGTAGTALMGKAPDIG